VLSKESQKKHTPVKHDERQKLSNTGMPLTEKWDGSTSRLRDSKPPQRICWQEVVS
jgi:hypothetical protein